MFLYIVLQALQLCYTLGDAAGQFTAAPSTCPGDTFTFSCTVVGSKSGFTIWRVGGSTECSLVHKTPPPYSTICGSHNVYTAMSGTGFATSGPSFTSTLNGTANLTMDSTQVECFGPANNADPGNRVNGSTLKILGLYNAERVVLQNAMMSMCGIFSPFICYLCQL